jgi:hypothetical protein
MLYTELRERKRSYCVIPLEFHLNILLVIAATCLISGFLFIVVGAFLEVRAAVKFQATLKTKLGFLAFRQQIRKSEFGPMHRNGRILRTLGIVTLAGFFLWACLHH